MEVFKKMLSNALQNELGDDYDISFKNVVKNNGVELTGVMIKKKDQTIAPVIYIDNLLCNGKPFVENVKTVLDMYHSSLFYGMPCAMGADLSQGVSFSTKILDDFDKARSSIYLKLSSAINCEHFDNEGIPYRKFNDDLIINPYILIKDNKQNGTCNVTFSLINIWKTTINDIFKIAEENMSTLRFNLTDINSIVPVIEGSPDIMYVCNSEEVPFGASAILCDHVINEFAKMAGGKFHIIPSSIYELLFLKVADDMNPNNLLEIIADVNDNTLEKSEILSYKLYYFDGKNVSIYWPDGHF